MAWLALFVTLSYLLPPTDAALADLGSSVADSALSARSHFDGPDQEAITTLGDAAAASAATFSVPRLSRSLPFSEVGKWADSANHAEPLGPKGQKGDPGVTGVTGDPGSLGTTGATGDIGSGGPPGPPGDRGAPGLPGDTGRPGLRGHDGPPGDDGPTGDDGPSGMAGTFGTPGATGDRGPAGAPGSVGERGADGAVGAPGVDGEPGDTGSTGQPGERGFSGPDGVTAAGPAGGRGESGPAGTAGAAGPPGLRGPAGARGQTGVEGSAGDSGAAGVQGATGPSGASGERGPRGITGAEGERGGKGTRGSPGPIGDPGPRGPPGDQGQRGPKGPGVTVEATTGLCRVLAKTGSGGCLGRCIDVPSGGYVCACDAGYALDTNASLAVSDCDVGSLQCYSTFAGRLCYCAVAGLARPVNGSTCVDVDECAATATPCDHFCQNTAGSYACSCRPGYRLVGGRYCRDIDECAEQTANGGCSHGCVNVPGGYYCSCPAYMSLSTSNISTVYRRRVATCPPPQRLLSLANGVQLCTSAAGSGGGDSLNELALVDGTGGCYVGDVTCVFDVGYHRVCFCATGTTTVGAAATSTSRILPLNGTQCQRVDECSAGLDQCDHACSDAPVGYACSCKPGYALSPNGRSCLDINECTAPDGRTPCPALHLCVNTEGSFACLDTHAGAKAAYVADNKADESESTAFVGTPRSALLVSAASVATAIGLATALLVRTFNRSHRQQDPVEK